MEADGGVLEVRLTDISLDDDFASAHPGIKPGPHIQLSVADTGKGIAESVLGKIFDPFFTTKAAGKGTGMGLSVVHGIVATTGGAITVENRTGRGLLFYGLPAGIDRAGCRTLPGTAGHEDRDRAYPVRG